MITPPMPRLWKCLCREWCRLPDGLSWCWWRSVHRARWSLAAVWREDFLAFAQQEGRLAAEEVEQYFMRAATPRTLIELIEVLVAEHRLWY